MLKSFWGVFSFILCAVFAVSLTASAADDAREVFVVSSSFNGDAYYLSLPDKDALSSQVILQETSNPVISSAVAYHYSNGNGLGDFDNDGDLDYIMAIGFWFGNIYISEKGDVDNDFAAPTLAGIGQGRQTRQRIAIGRHPVRLAHDGTRPVQPQPSQIVKDRLFVFGPAAVAVDILDPQPEIPRPRRHQRRERMSQVQKPRGRGRKARYWAASHALKSSLARCV